MIARPNPGSSKRGSAPRVIQQFLDTVEARFAHEWRVFTRGIVVGQSPFGDGSTYLYVAQIGEQNLADGHDYPVLTRYSTPTVGAAGGPQAGDDVLIVRTQPDNPIIFGKVNHS